MIGQTLSIALAVALCALGCGTETRTCDRSAGVIPDERFQLCELPDPEQACVSGDGACESSSQCAGGLTCMKLGPGASCSEGLDDVECRCRPLGFHRLATGSGRLALQHGFGVGGMPSSVDTAEVPPRLTWQAPSDARLVACALFSCPPVFRRAGCSPTDENELSRIDNFEQCVLLFAAVPATQPGFILGPENAYQGASRCTAPEDEPGAVIELVAGCWAYDTTSLIAASELHPIRGSLLAGIPGLPNGGACPADGAACYDAAADRFGVCLDGACRPRCRSPADCALADAAPATGGACGWSCRVMPDQELGACVPAP